MRSWALLSTVVIGFGISACTGGGGSSDRTLAFGPFTVAPSEEIDGRCVQLTLHNDQPLYINAVELTTGRGFHHSNWFFVPEHVFAGDDGEYTCTDRAFNEPVAAIYGGVLFAQSTQSPHEIQQFPEGHAIKIPAHYKLVAQIHLLNPTDETLKLEPTIKLHAIDEAEVLATLAGVSFENHALGLPPHKQSRFTVDCDLAPLHQLNFHRDPDFHMFYGLAHYHTLGTGMTVEAVKPDGGSAVVFTTANRAGDNLGGMIDPAFDMTGYTRLRVSCDFYNSKDTTVTWGIGGGEMCVFLGFSDSQFNWAGGDPNDDPPGEPEDVGGVMSYSHACEVYTNDAQR